MKFDLIDEVLEQTAERIVAVKQVSRAEEYLADHFPTFPVLPGVLMLETLAQAARRLLEPRGNRHLVVGEVKALKFGAMVRPGQQLVVEVEVQKELPDGAYACRGLGRVRRTTDPEHEEVAVAGRFTMRPLRVEIPAAGPGACSACPPGI